MEAPLDEGLKKENQKLKAMNRKQKILNQRLIKVISQINIDLGTDREELDRPKNFDTSEGSNLTENFEDSLNKEIDLMSVLNVNTIPEDEQEAAFDNWKPEVEKIDIIRTEEKKPIGKLIL